MEAAAYTSLTMIEAHDFISPLVMEYLGVRSLVRFSATTKRHLKCKDMEVARRKEQFTECFKEFKSPLGKRSHPRANITKALSIRNKAKHMIDSELDWLNDDRPRTPKKDKLFREERETFHERFNYFSRYICTAPHADNKQEPNNKRVRTRY
eukprot:scaffold358969_cov71-Attheya_sp.AAC.1